LQLNPNKDLTKTIDDCLDKVIKLTDTCKVDEFDNAIKEMVANSRILLKQEWEEVKKESRGLIFYYLDKKVKRFIKKT